LGREKAVTRDRDAAQLKRDIKALLAFIDSHHAVPYAWGRTRNDCVGFVLGAVKAQTGHSRATRVRWSSQKAGLKAIAEFGSLEAAFDHFFVRIKPAQAMRGDIAGVPDERFGIHPMIVEGETLVAPGDKGNRRCPRKMMICAWSAVLKVPHHE
jgi:hypothetical protein